MSGTWPCPAELDYMWMALSDNSDKVIYSTLNGSHSFIIESDDSYSVKSRVEDRLGSFKAWHGTGTFPGVVFKTWSMGFVLSYSSVKLTSVTWRHELSLTPREHWNTI